MHENQQLPRLPRGNQKVAAFTYGCPECVVGSSLLKMKGYLLMVEWLEARLSVYRGVCLMRARADHLDDRRIPRVLTHKDQRLPRLPHGDHKELCIDLRLSKTCTREQSNESEGRVGNGGKARGIFGDTSRELTGRGGVDHLNDHSIIRVLLRENQ
jgi:hypothetical protein